jgi:hypothetical protein
VASQVFFVLALATSGVSQTSAAGADSAKANDSAVSIFAILDRESKIDYSSEEGVTIASVRGDVDFQKVCFKYPLRPNVQIFKDFSLRIPSGKVAPFFLIIWTHFFHLTDAELDLNNAIIYIIYYPRCRLSRWSERVEAASRR